MVDQWTQRMKFNSLVLLFLLSLETSLARNASWKVNSEDWCSLDSGTAFLVNQFGTRQPVHISLTREGGVWVRLGSDQSSSEWIVEEETRLPLQLSVLEPSEINFLTYINYTDFCALTDLTMRLRADSGWHPSYLTVFDPREKDTKIVLFRHNRDCQMSTNLSLSTDKQGLFCEGGLKTACGQRNLPENGYDSSTVFLRSINFDPVGPDRWQCDDDQSKNSYTFRGSYYHVYAKMASCDKPRDSRTFGHETKMRPNKDESIQNAVLLPDPSHGSLSDGLIIGWRLFVKILSVRHEVYLQVWRRSTTTGAATNPDVDIFSLVGETFVRPTELRYTEYPLEPRQFLRIKKGDILGLYFPNSNPIGWSSVPCAFKDQHYKVALSPSKVIVGRSLKFDTSPSGDDACRQYSFLAIFANRSESKLVEDWVCPTAFPMYGTSRRSGSQGKDGSQHDGLSSVPGSQDGSEGPKRDRGAPTDDSSIPVHILLTIVASLLVLMSVTGLVSYCKAVRN